MWNAEGALTASVAWLKAQRSEAGAAGVLFGLSGGLDSAVVAGLCRRAFSREALGLFLDCESDPTDAADARLAAEILDLNWRRIELCGIYREIVPAIFGEDTDTVSRLTLANLKARLRMLTLYAWANRLNYLVIGTGNLAELTVGYFTKYGDGAADLLPLGGLVKGRVRALGVLLGLPARILTKPPSAGLWPGQTDEAELGLSYEILDRYLLGGEADPETAARIERLRARSEHKRCPPPISPVS